MQGWGQNQNGIPKTGSCLTWVNVISIQAAEMDNDGCEKVMTGLRKVSMHKGKMK